MNPWHRPCRLRRGNRSRASLRAAILVAAAAWLVAGRSSEAQSQSLTARLMASARPERTAAERTNAARRLREKYLGDREAWPTPHVDPGVEWREIGLLPPVVHPESNPLNSAKVTLGKALFFDARLSGSGQVACVSCHEPGLAWADGRAVSQPHVKAPGRNTPTIRNAAFQPALFWDGRAASLERQAEEALTNPVEMAANRDVVVRLLADSPGYRKLFAEAFPDRPLEFDRVVEALACFERTVVGGRSRFDAFLRGDAAALTDQELLGLDLFRREAKCMNCHHGPVFSDGLFHNLGLSFYLRSNEDQGRYAVSGDPKMNGRFRTPTLRDVTQTGPLMHTGAYQLTGVLNMYNAGMATQKRYEHQREDPLFPEKSPLLKPLGLNRQDLADLAAFLGTLEEPRRLVRPPVLPDIADAIDVSLSR